MASIPLDSFTDTDLGLVRPPKAWTLYEPASGKWSTAFHMHNGGMLHNNAFLAAPLDGFSRLILLPLSLHRCSPFLRCLVRANDTILRVPSLRRKNKRIHLELPLPACLDALSATPLPQSSPTHSTNNAHRSRPAFRVFWNEAAPTVLAAAVYIKSRISLNFIKPASHLRHAYTTVKPVARPLVQFFSHTLHDENMISPEIMSSVATILLIGTHGSDLLPPLTTAGHSSP